MATATDPIIGINGLPYYLKRICAFLGNDKKTISFPRISEELKKALIKLAENNADFLLADEYSNNVKLEAEKVAAAMKTMSYKLTHEIRDGEHGSNILMYKKTQSDTFKAPAPLRKPSVIKQENAMEPPPDGTVTMIFKTRCLNAATKFVKDDSQLVMRFPEMTDPQAEFVVDMILPGTSGRSESSDVGFGYRSVYAPLWESMRLFGLKYDFKIDYDTRPDTKEGMKSESSDVGFVYPSEYAPLWESKRLFGLKYDFKIDYDTKPVTKEGLKQIVFEKIPKKKPKEVINLDLETPEVSIDLDCDDALDDTISTSSSVSLRESKVFTKSQKNFPKERQPRIKSRVNKLIKKLKNRMSYLPDDFVCDALQRISEFLLDDRQTTIVFNGMAVYQQYFLANVAKLSRNRSTYMLFTTASQICLDNIKYCLDVKNLQYEIKYVKTRKGSANILEFEKIFPGVVDAESSEPLNSTISTISTSSSTVSSKPLKSVLKVMNQLVHKLQKGYLTEEIIETTLQSICDFCHDEKKSLVLQPMDLHHVQFIQKVLFFAREPDSHRVFTSNSRALLASIYSCIEKNLQYQVKQVKGKTEVILEKMIKFSKKSDRNSLSSPSSTSVGNLSVSKLAQIKDRANMTKTQRDIVRLYKRMQSGDLKGDFVKTTLLKICDFMHDEQQGSIHFHGMKAIESLFVKHVLSIARDESWHSVFSTRCQSVLAELNRCFNGNILYEIRHVKKDVFLEKIARFPSDEPNDTGNNENVNNTNTESKVLTKLDQDLLIRLKATKDKVVREHGEETVMQYLQDISIFLTQSNTDKSITFAPITETEAMFLKNVHVLSKLDAAYPLFSRNCQKLLRSIRFNAEEQKIKFQMIADTERQGYWTVIIEKKIPDKEETKEINKNVILETKHYSIKALYEACRQTVQKEQTSVQQRSRSESAGRRTASNIASTIASKPMYRGTSTHRSIKDQLKAALAQPVLPDKALRMMENMGWKGGALGPRGEGITEPISLPLDLSKRAGLGHVPPSKKTKEPKPKPEPKARKPTKTQIVNPNVLPANMIPPGICPTDKKCNVIVLNKNYQAPVLRSILEIITTDLDEVHYVCSTNPLKVIGFLKHSVKSFNGRHRFDLCDEEQKQLVAQIARYFDNCRGVILNTEIRNKTELFPRMVIIRKMCLIPQQPKEKEEITNEIISLIDDGDESKDSQQTKVNKQDTNTTNKETTKIWYQESSDEEDQLPTSNEGPYKDVKESTVPWYQMTQPSSRQWYFPVKLKPQTNKKSIVSELKITKNLRNKDTDVPELKTLALLAVCKLGNLETDVQPNVTTDCHQIKAGLTKSIDELKLATQGDHDRIDDNIKSAIQPNIITESDPSNEHEKIETNAQPELISQNNQTETNENIKSIIKPTILKEDDQTQIGKHHMETDSQLGQDDQITTFQPTKITEENQTQMENHNMETDTQSTQNVQTKTNTQSKKLSNVVQEPEVKVTKKAKLIVKVPNMTRRQLAVLTQGEQTDIKKFQTTYSLEVEQHQFDKAKHTVVKVSKNSLNKNVAGPKRIKIEKDQAQQGMSSNSKVQESEKVEVKKPPGVLLLEKLIVNNNNSTMNKNVAKNENVKAENSSVSARLQNAVNRDITLTEENIQITVNNTASAVKKNAPLNDEPATTRAMCDTDVLCDKTKNMKLVEDKNPKTNNVDKTQMFSATYIVPLETIITVENAPVKIVPKAIQNNTKTATEQENKTNKNCVNKVNKSNSCKNEPYDKDIACEVTFHDSTRSIVINDGEEIILISDDDDDEIDIPKVPIIKPNVKDKENVTKVKDMTRKVMKAKRSVQKTPENNEVTIKKENKSVSYYDAMDTVPEKEEPRPASTQDRKRPSLDEPKTTSKKCKPLPDFKTIYILPQNYPKTKIDGEKAREIQSAILKTIDYTEDTLPLLKCQGIQNGVLIYSCQDEKSLFFIEKLVQDLDDLKIVYKFDIKEMLTHKMAFRISSYVDEPVYNVLNRLELYHKGLFSTKWSVLKKEQCGDFTVIHVEVDNDSFDYICEANFVLHAGNDCARFTIVWD